jgi:hypothetical protein
MKPFGYKNYTYSGIAVSSECPFFPVFNGLNGTLAKINFNQAYVFNYPDLETGGVVDSIEVSAMNVEWEVAAGDIFYLKLTFSDGVLTEEEVEASATLTDAGKVKSAELVRSNEEPVDAANILYIKVCEFGDKGAVKEILLRENIYWGGVGGGSEINHPWKVTQGTSGTWDYIGGIVHTCGQGVDILVNSSSVSGEQGYILLKTTRDSVTRNVTAAEVIWSSTVLDSDYTYQYRVLALVDPNGSLFKVLQHQFEEIRIYEKLIVVNGTFALEVQEVSLRNNYEPPV